MLLPHPDLIPGILPELYNDFVLKGPILSAAIESAISHSELKGAFLNLIDRLLPRLKIVFFIDGIDEYDGDHGEISSLLRSVTSCANVKTLLSSRPIRACSIEFEFCPQLSPRSHKA